MYHYTSRGIPYLRMCYWQLLEKLNAGNNMHLCAFVPKVFLGFDILSQNISRTCDDSFAFKWEQLGVPSKLIFGKTWAFGPTSGLSFVLVGTTNNSELGGPRTSWIDKILLPHLFIVCFITFLTIYEGKFGFGKFQQKLGLRSDPPPPCWAKSPSFSENLFWWHP